MEASLIYKTNFKDPTRSSSHESMFVLSLYVLAQLDRKHEHLVALGAFVALVHPVVPQLMDTLCAVGIKQPSANFAWIDAGSCVNSIYVAAEIKLGRHENSTKSTLPFLSTCNDNKIFIDS